MPEIANEDLPLVLECSHRGDRFGVFGGCEVVCHAGAAGNGQYREAEGFWTATIYQCVECVRAARGQEEATLNTDAVAERRAAKPRIRLGVNQHRK